jgi:hypothetical protein
MPVKKREKSSEQITLYNKLRGYSSDDPCQNVPKGHDPKMWKKHHNCPWIQIHAASPPESQRLLVFNISGSQNS